MTPNNRYVRIGIFRSRHIGPFTLLLTLIILQTLALNVVHAQQQSRHAITALDRIEKAVEIIEKSVEANGGRAAFDSLKTLEVSLEGKWTRIGQAFEPRTGLKSDEMKFVNRYNFAVSQVSWDFRMLAQGGTRFFWRWITNGDESYYVSDDRRYYYRFGRTRFIWEQADVTVSLRILQRAYENRAMAHWLGSVLTADGKITELVMIPFGSLGDVILHFDAKGGDLLKLEGTGHLRNGGDLSVEYLYHDYRQSDGIRLAYRVVELRKEEPYGDLVVSDVKVNPEFQPEDFGIPGGYTELHIGAPHFEEIDDGIFVLNNTDPFLYYNLFVVEFDEFVVVGDLSNNSQNAQRAIAMIEERFPNKPIRFAVASHFHDDHTGGARAFVSKGITILGSRSSISFMKRSLGDTFISRPDWYAASPRQPKFEMLEGERTISDGHRELRIIKFETPHVDENYVFYVPGSGVLFNADFFTFIAPLSPFFREFGEQLEHFQEEGNRLEVIVGAHHPPVDIQDFIRITREGMPPYIPQ